MEHDNQQINGWVSRTSADGRTRQTFEYNSAGDFGPSTSGSSPHIPGSIIPPPGGELSNDLRIPGTTVPRLGDDDTSVSSVLEAFDFGPVFNFLIMLFLLVSLVLELSILFALVQRVRTFGLTGFMTWLDELMSRAIKTPAFLFITVFSFIIILLLWVVIATQGHSINMLGEYCHNNSLGIIKIQDIINGSS